MAIKVLFVCTGNSCRSVMAHGLLQKRLKELEIYLKEPVLVDSAGAFAIEGMAPTRETQQLLLKEGIDMAGHLAKHLSATLIGDSNLVLVMEQFHQDEVLQRATDAKAKTYLLKVYGNNDSAANADPNIHDPIGKPMEVYEVCFDIIKEAIERVAQSLIDKNIS